MTMDHYVLLLLTAFHLTKGKLFYLFRTTGYCATLVNTDSTSPCRKKRQFWGAPVIFAVDEGLDQFNPSPILK